MKRALFVVASVGLLAFPSVAAGQTPSAAAPTFAKDVAPILYKNCVVCHRPGEVAPMSLISYEQARPWVRAIKQKVVAREMPPWLADQRYGKFANDRSLTQKEIDTIVAWVDSGALKGNEKDLPQVPTFAGGWDYGAPDVVVQMPVEIQLPAEGEIDNQSWYAPVPFKEDTFIHAVQLLPSAQNVVHHAGSYVSKLPDGTKLVDGKPAMADGSDLPRGLIQRLGADNPLTEGAAKLVSYVPGRGSERYPEGTAKRIPVGWSVSFGMHYQASGKPEKDRTRLGLWLAKGPVKKEMMNDQQFGVLIAEGKEVIGDGDFGERSARIPNIPPYVDNWKLVSVKPFSEGITLYALSPHMHLRGKDITYVITFPDGREETVLSVPRYDFNWQLYYELEKPIQVPAGSKISAIAHFDNSLKNKYNPAPDKEVFWSEQSWDEMFSPQMRYTIDNQDLTKPPARTQQQQ